MHIFNIFWKGYWGAQQELTLLETYTLCKESRVMWQRRWEAEIVSQWTTNFFPKMSSYQKGKDRITGGWGSLFPSSKAAAAHWDGYIDMAKSIAWGQSQFLPSSAGDLLLQGCAWWAVVVRLGKFSESQARGNEPSFGTAALANLMLNVTQYWSFHAPCMENLMSRHILPWGWGGRGVDTVSFLPR